jgi:RNA polymerase sigma factor (sigma-70 family)
MCRDTGAAAAWDEFVLRTQRLIAGTIWNTIRRWGVSESVVIEDLVQETYLKISANQAASLRAFESQHPNAILGYLKAAAVSVTHDYCKGKMASKRGAGMKPREVTELNPPASEQSAEGAAAIEYHVLTGQIDKLLQGLPQDGNARRDRQIFWLYYRQGLTASSIAAIPSIGLSVKGVESVLQRLTRLVRLQLTTRTGRPPASAQGMPSGSSL